MNKKRRFDPNRTSIEDRNVKSTPAFSRTVRNLVAERAAYIGIENGTKEYAKLVTETRREALRKVRLREFQQSYISPNILLKSIYKDGITKRLCELNFVIENEDHNDIIRIMSDSSNVQPDIVSWCNTNRKKLVNNATDSEIKVAQFVEKCMCFTYRFQEAFYICDSIYFADFYFPNENAIIEVDGKQHLNSVNKIKDELRTLLFNSIGIQVFRISNEDVLKSDVSISNLIETLKIRTIYPKTTEKINVNHEQRKGKGTCSAIWEIAYSIRQKMFRKALGYVLFYSDKLKECKIKHEIKYPFIMDGKIYFADLYIPECNLAIDLIKPECIGSSEFAEKQHLLSEYGVKLIDFLDDESFRVDIIEMLYHYRCF